MKIYEILKEENVGKTYFDDTISEEWKVVRYERIAEEKPIIALETLEDETDVKDYWNLSLQEILEMDFEETEEDE